MILRPVDRNSFALVRASMSCNRMWPLPSSSSASPIFSNADASGVDPNVPFDRCEVVAVSFLAFSLLKHTQRLKGRSAVGYVKHTAQEAMIEIKRCFRTAQSRLAIVSTVLPFAQWLIQRKIVFRDGGTSKCHIQRRQSDFQICAVHSFDTYTDHRDQTRSSGSNVGRRRKIALRSLRCFPWLPVCACAAVFVGLRIGIPFLPARYAAAVEIRASLPRWQQGSNHQGAVFVVFPIGAKGIT